MLKKTMIIFIIFIGGCSNSSSPPDAKKAISQPDPASTVAVTKQPLSHTVADLKKAFRTPTADAGNVQKGAKLARKCLACHTVSNHKKRGPGLASIYNRDAGSMPDMQYSPALQHANWQWDTPHLAAWLCDSHKALQTFSGKPNVRSKMPAQHICDPKQQADIIAYMKTL